MLSFIQNNLKYPTVDLANNVSGKVEVTFTVQSDGSLTNIKITKGLTETTNNEVIRVFKLMPKWIAGTIDGKKSSLEVTIPVTFSF
jgi:protein TonB